MKLSLKNFGKIEKASVEMDGITVIAGENNTGKSTVGKALYCLFHAFYNMNDTLDREREKLIFRVLVLADAEPIWSSASRGKELERVSHEIGRKREQYIEYPRKLKERMALLYKGNEKLEKNSDPDHVTEKILAYLKLDDDTIKANVMRQILALEYQMQVGYVDDSNTESRAVLEIRDQKVIDIHIKPDESVKIDQAEDIYSNLAYIDDPFVVDRLSNFVPYRGEAIEDHRDKLIQLLTKKNNRSLVSGVIEEMVVSERLNHILEILNKACEGSLLKTEDSYGYSSKKIGKPLSLSNVSTGLKTFLILKTLLMNGSIEEGGTIVFDEPEIHLHPEWQLLLAELIVLIQKEFKLHVLLNTHSPYFLRAIQVYSAKYDVADICKYYLAEARGDRADIVDVTDNIERIYEKLSRPLQRLEDERWESNGLE
ncbi:MAG TPA: ATP-binding protein [Candidatus Fimimorpha excrementavium]|nr:ATP-binding protein [Candidatus Fimimorpha excrementavium]